MQHLSWQDLFSTGIKAFVLVTLAFFGIGHYRGHFMFQFFREVVDGQHTTPDTFVECLPWYTKACSRWYPMIRYKLNRNGYQMHLVQVNLLNNQITVLFEQFPMVKFNKNNIQPCHPRTFKNRINT